MARIDLARRAEIGREKRARTRAQILEAGAMLLAERPPEALTVDAVVEAAGVAKGTFYYHFQSMEELAAAVGEKLGESFDELLAPARRGLRDPIARISFAFTQFLDKAMAEPRLGAPRGPKRAGPDRLCPAGHARHDSTTARAGPNRPSSRGGASSPLIDPFVLRQCA